MIELGDRIVIVHTPKTPELQPFYDMQGFVYGIKNGDLYIELDNGTQITAEVGCADVERLVQI